MVPRNRRLPLVVAAVVLVGGGIAAARFLFSSPLPANEARVATEKPTQKLQRVRTPAPPVVYQAAPLGARPQPHRPRALTLSASGISLSFPEGRAVTSARRLLQKGDAEAALAAFKTLAEREPKQAEAWYGVALCQYELGQDGPARAALDRALEQVPSHRASHLLAGFLDQQAGRIRLARKHYQKFLGSVGEGPPAEDVRSILEQLPNP